MTRRQLLLLEAVRLTSQARALVELAGPEPAGAFLGPEEAHYRVLDACGKGYPACREASHLVVMPGGSA